MALFPLPVKAEMSDRLRMPARILQFGDGGEQTALDGLNRQHTTWDVEVIIASSIQDALLNTFLQENGQHKSFTWQSPRDTFPQPYRITGDVSSTRRNGGGSKPVFFSRRMQFKSTSVDSIVSAVRDPLYQDVVLLLLMRSSNPFGDEKLKIVNNFGAIPATSISDPFGTNNGVLFFPGGSTHIAVNQNNDFAFGASALAIDGWLYPTSFPTGLTWGLMDSRSTPNTATGWSIAGNVQGQISMYDTSSGSFQFRSPPLTLNTWNYFCFSRSANLSDLAKLWVNGVLTGSDTSRNNSITAPGVLRIGATADVLNATFNRYQGYMSGIRITKAYRDGSIVPSLSFPTS